MEKCNVTRVSGPTVVIDVRQVVRAARSRRESRSIDAIHDTAPIEIAESRHVERREIVVVVVRQREVDDIAVDRTIPKVAERTAQRRGHTPNPAADRWRAGAGFPSPDRSKMRSPERNEHPALPAALGQREY